MYKNVRTDQRAVDVPPISRDVVLVILLNMSILKLFATYFYIRTGDIEVCYNL